MNNKRIERKININKVINKIYNKNREIIWC